MQCCAGTSVSSYIWTHCRRAVKAAADVCGPDWRCQGDRPGDGARYLVNSGGGQSRSWALGISGEAMRSTSSNARIRAVSSRGA